jgi:hypothetical protein
MQIIQIGANIIDQYGADNFPTAIYFPYLSAPTLPGGAKPTFDPVAGNGGSIANALFGPVTMVYGVKNLPLLSKIVEAVCSPNPVGPLGANGVPTIANYPTTTMEGWLQPELWNPHQQPNSPLSNGATTPVNFEIRAYGNAYTYSYESHYNYLSQNQYNPPPPGNPLANGSVYNVVNGSDPETYYPGQSSTESPTTTSSSGGPQAATLVFSVDNTKFPFYTPRLLTIDNLPGVTVNMNYGLPPSTTVPTSFAGSNFPYYGTQHAPTSFQSSPIAYYNHFAAFSTGVDNYWYVEGGPTPSVSPGGGYTGVDFALDVSPYPTTGVSFALGWYPAGQSPTASNFHPYSFISGCFLEQASILQYLPQAALGDIQSTPDIGAIVIWAPVDPRTSRFSHGYSPAYDFYNCDILPDTSDYALCQIAIPGYNSIASTISPNNFVSPPVDPIHIGNNFPQDWICNTPAGTPRLNNGDPRLNLSYPYTAKTVTYYADPDGVVRPADGGAYIDYMNLHPSYVPPALGFNLGIGLNVTTYDGNMLFLNKGSPTAATGGTDPVSSTDNGGVTQHGRRPVFLNRPFRSVGELGYVSRDMPFKTLDFFSGSSADAALLDVFSLTDESKVSSSGLGSVVAGEVDLSNAPMPVIQAILTGGSKKDVDSTYNIGAEAATIAQNCAIALNPAGGPNPLLNRAALVTQLQPALIAATTTANFNTADMANKAYLEAPVRALADVTNTRTWNLMIDIIAQSGQMSPNAKPGDTNALSEFVVEGEKRYWLHIAIDRYTGKIVDQQLEPVYE